MAEVERQLVTDMGEPTKEEVSVVFPTEKEFEQEQRLKLERARREVAAKMKPRVDAIDDAMRLTAEDMAVRIISRD